MRRRLGKWRPGAAIVLVVTASACGRGASPTAPSAAASSAAAVAAHLDQLVTIMQSRSLNRASIDWPAFRSSVTAAAGSSQSIADAYPAIRTALSLLGDNHSFYVSATGTTISASSKRCSGLAFDPPLIPDRIGYVRVPAFSGSGSAAAEFAGALQRAITRADRSGLAGWIVDLRGNSGGNMWPMIAGIGPILDEGTLGYFVDPSGSESTWEYRGGAALLSGAPLQTLTPYRLSDAHPRVAVLIDGGVASSGEAVAVAFRRRPGARSFGSPTCGLSTANATIPLNDGATLYLTVSVMADRGRVRYGEAIVPDEHIEDPTDTLRRALAWLQSGI
jgi:Peptidase family S41